MELGIFEILVGLVVGLYLLYYYLTKDFDYWQKRNVKGPTPRVLYGTSKDFSLRQFFGADSIKEIYDAYPDEPVVGLFARRQPMLMVKDPDIIKDVLVKSFTSFADRAFHIHYDIEPYLENLFLVDYPVWKPLRKKLAPVFTSGKLKDMFYLISECTEHFVEFLDELVVKDKPIECRDLTAKFTTDVIGVCAFGLNTNALADGDSEFRKVGRSVTDDSWSNRALFVARLMPHWIARILIPIVRDDNVSSFFISTMKNTMEYRKKNNVRRNDFVDLLMDIRNHPEQVGEKEMTDVFITAQALVFFLAGFETSSAAISHTLYEMALNPDIQDKLRTEVKEVCDKNGGKLTYDSIKSMKYLDKVLKESLRKYPPVLFLSREAAEDHTFESSNISVNKKTPIIIPTHAIHHDPRIYPDPEKFDPERFDEEVEESRPHMSYIPFGDGPRMCIGDRFARYQSKLGIAAAVKNFTFGVCEDTPKVYKKRLAGMLLVPKHGLHLKIKKIT